MKRLVAYSFNWRNARGLSQMELALRAASTSRHISFMETGRSRPTEQMVLRLAEALEIPIRDRNNLLQSAGLGAVYSHINLSQEELAPYHKAIQTMLQNHSPFPAMVINRWYDVVDANATARKMFALIDKKYANNMIKFIFGEPQYKEVLDNWEDIALAMTARFGTPRKVTLDELGIEIMYPMVQTADNFFRSLQLFFTTISFRSHHKAQW